MRAAKWTIRRRLAQRLVPKLTPGKHRYCVYVDGASA